MNLKKRLINLRNAVLCFFDVVLWAVMKRRVPTFVVLSLADRCTFRCWYCRLWERNYDDMPTERIMPLLDEMKKAGVKHLALTGGEPLLREDLEEIPFSGRNVIQPDNELLLIYLCLHGTRDCWRDLESLAGIAALIQSQNGCEWGRVMELADRMHCRRMLRLTLTLVFALFKVGLPQTIMIDIEKDPAVSKLAATMCQNLFDTDRIDTKAEPKTKFSRFHLKVRDSWPEKFRYLRHLIFGTTIQEWRYFPMPARFSFLYGLLRPLRLFVAFLVGGIKAGVRFRVSGARKKVT